MNKKQRRHFADHEKMAILKRHLLGKVPVSDLCDELDIYPNQFYDWFKKFFENGHLAFANGHKAKAGADPRDQKIQLLESKVGIVNRQRQANTDASPFEGLKIAFDLAVGLRVVRRDSTEARHIGNSVQLNMVREIVKRLT